MGLRPTAWEYHHFLQNSSWEEMNIMCLLPCFGVCFLPSCSFSKNRIECNYLQPVLQWIIFKMTWDLLLLKKRNTYFWSTTVNWMLVPLIAVSRYSLLCNWQELFWLLDHVVCNTANKWSWIGAEDLGWVSLFLTLAVDISCLVFSVLT